MNDQQNHELLVYDARGNGGGDICPTITGDHQNRVTDYTAIVVRVVPTSSVYRGGCDITKKSGQRVERRRSIHAEWT